MKFSDKDLKKMMAFVIEHRAVIEPMLRVINEQCTLAGTEIDSTKYSQDGMGGGEEDLNEEDELNEAGEDASYEDRKTLWDKRQKARSTSPKDSVRADAAEKIKQGYQGKKDKIEEGDAEISGSDCSSDGVDYPDVGDGTGVEGETLKEDDMPIIPDDEDRDFDPEDPEDTEGDLADAYSEEVEVDEDDEVIEETCGAGTAAIGSPMGAAVTDGSGPGANTLNAGIAIRKERVGQDEDEIVRRLGENAKVETANDVKAMMESWKTKSHWVNLY